MQQCSQISDTSWAFEDVAAIESGVGGRENVFGVNQNPRRDLCHRTPYSPAIAEIKPSQCWMKTLYHEK
jgi:hypothetical protein